MLIWIIALSNFIEVLLMLNMYVEFDMYMYDSWILLLFWNYAEYSLLPGARLVCLAGSAAGVC